MLELSSLSLRYNLLAASAAFMELGSFWRKIASHKRLL